MAIPGELQIISFVIIMQIFVLLNPLSSFPFLVAASKKKMNVKRIALLSTLTAYIIAMVIALSGNGLFNLFGVSLDAFRIAGGIVLLLLGIDMIRSKDEDHLKVDKKGDHLISIIATPMLTGPATISYIALKANEMGRTPILINITAAFLIVGAIFFLMSVLIKKINPGVVNIVSRILGLFLTAVAVEMMSSGLIAIVKGVIV